MFKLLKTSPTISTPELNGLTANLSSKSEINLTVDLVGLSELLKLCLIESVSLPTKPFKLESQLKIYSLVVMNVEMDVTEDIPKLPGNTGHTPVLSLEIYTMLLINGANPTLLKLVTTTLMDL